MAKSKKRPTAVLNIGKLRRLGTFIFKVKGIRANIVANNAMFPTPVPTPATLLTNLTTLDDAQVAVEQRVPGAVGARDEAYSVVLDNFYELMAYVQTLANASANQQAAITIIQTSGYDLKIN